ncbi:hypothetical protein A33O_01877 [Nitratireductor aquibiodomus RA22]|uniref:Uncharacterized protein n=1 Tax=Nitratireductor aquibiodomus RA22 TaxID=1189611 RepID=I5C7K3_9HYPH|nr:hypothetical protein A33O_01877 [Nitratireductor aquibiodomus RA22]
MFGEMAFLHLDLASSAGGASPAHALHVNAKLPRGIEYGRAPGETPPLAGRHEENERIIAHGEAR